VSSILPSRGAVAPQSLRNNPTVAPAALGPLCPDKPSLAKFAEGWRATIWRWFVKWPRCADERTRSRGGVRVAAGAFSAAASG
jgi:hypothetical protein